MFKVLVCDGIAQKGVEHLAEDPLLEIKEAVKLTKDELLSIIGGFDGIIVRSQTKLTADVIEKADRLKVIGRAGVGVDNIDVPAASKKGIIVMNTPGGNTLSTAEQAMALMLALSRNTPQADASMKQGKWDRKKFMGMELFGKTLGIIGLGRIGKEVSKRAQSFGMRIIAFDPFLSEEMAERLAIESVDLVKLFKEADIITIHTPLTEETKGIISKKNFKYMKPTVKIINCARGGIVDEDDLYAALKDGVISGAALDVYSTEPAPEDLKLRTLDNIILTPHLGASTAEAQEKVGYDIAVQVRQALVGGTVLNAVNVPSVEKEMLDKLKPYMMLAEKLGQFIVQIASGQVKSVKVDFFGDVAELPAEPITMSALKGILSRFIEEPVNEVNAPFIAKERGISVSENKNAVLKDYAELLAVSLETQKGTVTVAGTVFGRKKRARIVEINDNFVDVIPEGCVLVLTNKDKPGTIGCVGTVLGEGGINIAGMTVGRMPLGEDAITVVNVDTEVPAAILGRIMDLPNIIDVKHVVF